jgi:MFS family permease
MPVCFTDRTLTAVVAARFVSLTGTNMTVVALPWFVLATTGSTTKMGLVLACETLPAFALGIPAGGLVASLGPRRALVFGDALRAPLLASVPLLHWAGVLSFPLLLVLVTAIGVFSVPYAAAASSILPEIVGEEPSEVARAQAALQVAIQVTGVTGPVIAGLVIPLIGSPSLLLLDGASYALSAAIVFALVRNVGRATPRAERPRGVLVGVRQVRRDPVLGSIVLTALAAHVGLAALFATLPALAFRSFHDPRTAGILFSADAAGSVLGGLVALWLARRIAPMRLGVAGFALMAVPIWVLALTSPRWIAVAALFIFGIGAPVGVSPISAMLTTRAPTNIRPQVVSAFLAITAAGTPLGAAGAGYAIAAAGFPVTYAAVAGAMTLATGLLAIAARGMHEAPAAALPVAAGPV